MTEDTMNFRICLEADKIDDVSAGCKERQSGETGSIPTFSLKIRNQVIAGTFRELDLIEQWGTGIRRIFKEAAEQGLQEPEITEIGMRVRMTISLDKPHKITTSSDAKTINRVNGGVNELLEFIRSNPGSKTTDFKIVLQQPQRTIERWPKRSIDDGKVEFQGAPKTGGYFVKIEKG